MKKNHKFLLIILLGILLRLLLMPFFAHQDLFSTYRRAEQYAFAGGNILKTTDPLAHVIEATWLKSVALFTGSDYFSEIHKDLPDITHINAFAFIFKFPYLIAEILFWWVLLKYFSIPKRVFAFFVFNPIILYSLYLFGRYESFMMLLTALLLVLLERGRLWQALITLVALLLTRFSMFLILPGIMLLKQSKLSKLVLLGLPIVLIMGFIFLNTNAAGSLLNWMLHGQHSRYLVATQLHLPFSLKVPVFPLAVGILLVYLHRKFSHIKELANAKRFAYSSLLILFLYYSLAFFHPHYFLWFMPFWLYLNQDIDRRIFWAVNIISIPLYFLFLLHWRGATTLQLLVPIADFFGYFEFAGENQAEFLYKISSLAKSLLSGLLLYAVVQISRSITSNNNG